MPKDESTMDAEIRLLADLNDFNAKYARFVSCNDVNMNKNNKLNCSTEDFNRQTVLDAYNKIIVQDDNNNLYYGDILDVDSTRTSYFTNSTGKSISQAEYKQNNENLKNTYNNDINKLRSEILEKMKELNDNIDSVSHEYSTRFNSTIYTGLMFTVLATSMLYYIFRKI
jgi:hypothetical protein